ncbi:unnamed protein product [Withania somnifera]
MLPQKLTPKSLLKLLKSEKNPNAALSLFDIASQHPNYTHNALIFHHILRKLSLSPDPKFLPHITRILDMIQTDKCFCSEDVALTVIKRYAKNSMVDKAIEVFQNMKSIFGCVPGLSRGGLFFKYFGTMGVSPNLETSNVLIKLDCKRRQFVKAKSCWIRCGGNGDLVKALEVFDEMFERGFYPDVTCYNILIDGFLKNGDYDRGKKIWERLICGLNVYPNVVSYNMMINGLCRCGKFNEGLKLSDRMKKNAQKMALFMCSTLIHGLCELGNVNGAERIFKEIIEIGLSPDVVVYCALLNGYCRLGRLKRFFESQMVDEAISIWKLMNENGVVADSTSHGIKNGCLNKAMMVLQAENQGERCMDSYAYSLDEATAMLDMMAKQGCTLSSHVCNELISGFLKTSKIQDALIFFGEMSSRNCSRTVGTYNMLIDGLCKAERFSDAYKLSLLMDGLCQSKKVDLALKLLNQIISKGFKPDVTMVNILIHGLCSAGNLVKVLQLFLRMCQWECLPNLISYNTFMEGFYKSRDCKNVSAPDIISYNITLKGDALNRKIYPTIITWNILVRVVIYG